MGLTPYSHHVSNAQVRVSDPEGLTPISERTGMTAPPDITACGGLLANYDVLFCDIWGVVHDGKRAFPAANAALQRFRDNGGTVVLVSNAPMPGATVARVLDEKGVVRQAWDAIVSSGDLALGVVAERGFRRVYGIGPEKRDGAFFAGLPGRAEKIADADALACTGLVDDRRETAEQYRPLLEQARARNLTFICANPDLAVHVGADLLPCAGAIAAIYEGLGGDVIWAGKPHALAYGTAKRVAENIRQAHVPNARILAIGDSIRTDLAAAEGAGVDALFIVSGIHRHETMTDGKLSAEKVARLFADGGPPAIAAAAALAW